MGKLKVVGRASRSVVCDSMTIGVGFVAIDKGAKEAIDRINEQCEAFLKAMSDRGYDISAFRIERNDISHITFGNEPDSSVRAGRHISFELSYSMRELNFITDIIRDSGYDTELSVSFRISDMIKLHNELIREAINDSKGKAEMIASVMGQKITGIDEVKIGEEYGSFNKNVRCMKAAAGADRSLSDSLGAQVMTEQETVEVVWSIE